MFVGHYSVAFAGRTEQNKIPRWLFFVAVQFLDYIWATLVLLGIALYLARNVMPAIRKWAVIVFGIVLVVIQIGHTYVPGTGLGDKATAAGVWIFYTFFVLIALAVEKMGTRPQTNAPGS